MDGHFSISSTQSKDLHGNAKDSFDDFFIIQEVLFFQKVSFK
jgi:hypothetical protein